MNTAPIFCTRQQALQLWLSHLQSKLAHRSGENKTFGRLRNLLLTKRLTDVAIANVLKNEGSRTPGVDGRTRKDYRGEESRLRLCEEIHAELKCKSYRPKAVRRKYIEKTDGSGKTRPLGIPTIKDRVVQEMLRLILEPIYEVHFHPHSYGFRPFRSTHHAAARVKDLIGNKGYDWVIEGDISKCFDRIDHDRLLRILRKRIKDGSVLKIISMMLKAGVLDNLQYIKSEEGTPQGGIVSPLLANIYLSELDGFIDSKYAKKRTVEQNEAKKQTSRVRFVGNMPRGEYEIIDVLWNQPRTTVELMEIRGVRESTISTQLKPLLQRGAIERCKVKGSSTLPVYQYWATNTGKREWKEANRLERERKATTQCFIVRYADDFVVLTTSKDKAEILKGEIASFLDKELKLELSATKTLITHVDEGFDFLGFNIKRYRSSGRESVLIKPAAKKVDSFKRKFKEYTKIAWSHGLNSTAISQMNLLIQGFGNYYRWCSSSNTFRSLDHFIWHTAFRMGRSAHRVRGKKHPNKQLWTRHYIPYKYDIRDYNRRRKGSNPGVWADKAKSMAYILTRITFIPIEYAHLHPQLNPFIPAEKEQLEENRNLSRLLYHIKKVRHHVNPDYGLEWLDARIAVLKLFTGKCANCGKKLNPKGFGENMFIAHHKVPRRLFEKSYLANTLENIVPVCPKCHAICERQSREQLAM